MSRILAVDPGDKRHGLAISDPTGVIARPLVVLEHTSRAADVSAIVLEAEKYEAETILVGIPYDLEGNPGPQARKALRLVEALREITPIPIVTWDESGSTQTARQIRKADQHVDAVAAAVILQEYLNAQTG
ncbi:MAG: Holliday junction resolvase RuvX [Anaerolineales bacterium]|nr:Holliday junction resolvase RuvX [Anaerolineales bacterium]MCK5635007.1 Holliday junction resolvase RuvX [Anaerolineales bacterium]